MAKKKVAKKLKYVLISYIRPNNKTRTYQQVEERMLTNFGDSKWYRDLRIHEPDKGKKFVVRTEVLIEEVK